MARIHRRTIQIAWLDESQAGIKIARRTINKLRYADDTTLMAERKEELKSLLMRVKKESERARLRLNIKKQSPDARWLMKTFNFLSSPNYRGEKMSVKLVRGSTGNTSRVQE